MINSIANLYHSEDISGDFLTQPLKRYHIFFANKIENCKGLKKGAFYIANIATGIFAYPLFGVLAGFGLLVKLMGVPKIKKHNEFQKIIIEAIQEAVQHTPSYFKEASAFIQQRGYRMHTVTNYHINKESVDRVPALIKEEIDSLSKHFRKVYVSSNGSIENGIGYINVELKVRVRISTNMHKR